MRYKNKLKLKRQRKQRKSRRKLNQTNTLRTTYDLKNVDRHVIDN